MPKRTADEVPTIPPGFDVEAYARESERRLVRQDEEDTSPGEARGSILIPKAPPTGVSVDFVAMVSSDSVPALAVPEPPNDAVSNPMEAFLLPLIDGRSTVESIADASGISCDLVLTTIADLLHRGVVVLR